MCIISDLSESRINHISNNQQTDHISGFFFYPKRYIYCIQLQLRKADKGEHYITIIVFIITQHISQYMIYANNS